mgnify:FL=1
MAEVTLNKEQVQGIVTSLNQASEQIAAQLEKVREFGDACDQEGVTYLDPDWTVEGNKAGHDTARVMADKATDVCFTYKDLQEELADFAKVLQDFLHEMADNEAKGVDLISGLTPYSAPGK